MKKSVLALFLVFLSGCATGSEFVSRVGEGLDSVFSSEQDETRVPVVYPAQQAEAAGKHSTLVDSYGPSWENMSAKYPEYTFN